MILLGVATQLCSKQSEGAGGVCDSLWPYVEAALTLADAVVKSVECFILFGEPGSVSRQEFVNSSHS